MHLEITQKSMFQGRPAPADSRLAGFAALVDSLGLQAPVRSPVCISEKHIGGGKRHDAEFTVFDKRYQPGDSAIEHLIFALRHENIDLLVLKRAFEAFPAPVLEKYIQSLPAGVHARRAWFLYETLTGKTLDVEASPSASAVDLLDEKAYFTGKARVSRRHKVRDNLLGNADWCPVIRRTKNLETLSRSGLASSAAELTTRAGARLAARAASFLLMADSRASFAIEGERPPRNRLERWGKAVIQSGKNPLGMEEILRLHSVLIEDSRLIFKGLRPDGVFLGDRDHYHLPLPEFIGARPEDIEALCAALLRANDRMRGDGLDPVLQAAATAFGFVYVHPFQDGNGRVHRCLIHNVLAERGFSPPGLVFPISSAMLDRIAQYSATLKAHSSPLMQFIEWRPTSNYNVEVMNETADLYRYFDCTEAAEFLYGCVQKSVEHDLPNEIEYLRRFDEAMAGIRNMIDMPDRLAQNLILFIRQNNGVLSKKRRKGEFSQLTAPEVQRLEAMINKAFEGLEYERY